MDATAHLQRHTDSQGKQYLTDTYHFVAIFIFFNLSVKCEDRLTAMLLLVYYLYMAKLQWGKCANKENGMKFEMALSKFTSTFR